MQRTLTRSLIFFFCARDRGICTLVNSAPRCLAAHGLAAAQEESIGMRSSVNSAPIFASAGVAEKRVRQDRVATARRFLSSQPPIPRRHRHRALLTACPLRVAFAAVMTPQGNVKPGGLASPP